VIKDGFNKNQIKWISVALILLGLFIGVPFKIMTGYESNLIAWSAIFLSLFGGYLAMTIQLEKRQRRLLVVFFCMLFIIMYAGYTYIKMH
jgi:uncharacterized membrane protein YfcA